MKLQLRENLRGKCPYCHDKINDDQVRCEECQTAHHTLCWEEHGGCTILGCHGPHLKSDLCPVCRKDSAEGGSSLPCAECWVWVHLQCEDDRMPCIHEIKRFLDRAEISIDKVNDGLVRFSENMRERTRVSKRFTLVIALICVLMLSYIASTYF